MSSIEQLKRERMIAKAIRDVTILHERVLQEAKSIRALSEDNRKELRRILNLPKGDKGDRGGIGPQGIAGRNGKDGVHGTDGYTPIKGKDYFTQKEKDDLVIETIKRIRLPKDGEDAVVDEGKIAELVLELIKEKKLISKDHIVGLNEEISSYRSQMALRQAGQHGGGDTVVAGTGITITPNANGTKTISATGGGTGTVTSVSVVSANGFAGSVANATTTPAITLTTTITGLLKGNGTAISAASAGTDYVAPGAVTSSGLTMASARLLGRTTASTGAIEEISIGSGLSLTGGVLAATGGGSFNLTVDDGVTSVSNVDTINFVGATVTDDTGGEITVTINAGGVSFGTEGQVPYMNATDDDFDYSANFTFDGSTFALTGVFDVTGSIDVDNININGNTISSTDTNGNLNFTPDGTGINVFKNAQVTSLTASEIVITDGSKNLVSASVSTYPSLTELTYLKGVTSSIQTQLNAKGSGTVTSVAASVPTGLTISGSPITTSGTLAIGLDTGYVIPLQTTLDGKANTALSNLASVAINTTLVSDTDNTDALGTTAIAWSDLFLGNGAVIAFNSAPSTPDVTITHASGILTNAISNTSTTPQWSLTQGSTGDAAQRFAIGTTRSYAIGIDNSDSDSFKISTAASGTAVLGTGDIFTLTSAGALTIASGLTIGGTLALGSNSITMSGSIGVTGTRVTKLWATDIESTNAPTVGGVALPTASSSTTFSNKDISGTTNTLISRTTDASTATPTPTGDSDFNHYSLTALATAPTFAAPSGTPKEGNRLTIRIHDNGTARALGWNAIYTSTSSATLPTTTVLGKEMYLGFLYDSTDSVWRLVAISNEL